MSVSHDLLVGEDWAGASLRKLVRALLAPFIDDARRAIDISGPDVFVTTTAAQNLGLALHELATNAAKYGALSTPAGRVGVTWSLDVGDAQARSLRIVWAEHGGPRVTPPKAKGFGHVVVERVVAQALNAAVDYDFREDGVVWAISVPSEFVVWQRTKADGT
jgi:two-component sensor histidine kinase